MEKKQKLFRDLMVKKCYLNEKKNRRERTTREGDARKVVFGWMKKKEKINIRKLIIRP